ncbi:MAG: glycerophosphodiester phosphodiesterase [Devosia sp.]|nr:glycerophosphodiester phosphodiesterase [Devosia sp.]
MTKHDFSPFLTRFGWPADRGNLPLCIGHRGASGHATENTLQAFALASRMGAEMWELDTQLTRDGVCVVSHDDHLERVFGVDRRISEMSAAELAALPGVEVPTFAEVAALARTLNAGLYIELKAPGTGQICWRELMLHDQRFACLGSFDTAQVRELRDSGCDYPLSVLVRVGHDPHALGDSAGADILHLCWERAGERPQDLVTEALLARAFRAGREIVLWHEERPQIIVDIVKLPVLGVCTDLPETLRPQNKRVASA